MHNAVPQVSGTDRQRSMNTTPPQRLEPARAGESPDTFADLLALIASNADRTAFARLFGYFAPRLKSHLVRQGLEDAEAEREALEVMVAVWRQAARFDRRRSSAATFVFRIARNRRLKTLGPSSAVALRPVAPGVAGASRRLALVS